LDAAETVLTLPAFCLVLLVGASGAGKSTFAARHFRPTEIVSSDTCRALVSDDEADQSASAAAFELVHLIAGKRLAARRLTVIDATNLKVRDRQPLLALARRFHAPVVTFAFLLDAATCVARNRERGAQGGRDVGAEVVAMQQTELRKGMPDLQKVGNLTAFATGTAVDRITEVMRIQS